ncbi:MAG: glycosyltransferase family 4 protein [Gammaproteobacteria bacterium]
MRLCLELTAVCRPVRTGIARYAEHLARAMVAEVAAGDRTDTIACAYRLSRWPRRHLRLSLAEIRSIWIQEPWWPVRPAFDLVHGLDARVPDWKHVKKVATVHDLFSLHPEAQTPEDARERTLARYRWLARISDRIICPSESTRSDFLARFEFPPDSVEVIHLGVEPGIAAPAPRALARWRREQGFERDYILFVGEFGRRKNLARLLRAYIRSGLSSAYELVYVGHDPGGMRDGFARIINAGGVASRVRFPGYMTGANLNCLYAAASAFAFPSLYEGFGLPVLEAMACGTPVLTSNLSATAELGREHAVLVDPYSEASIAEGLLKAVKVPLHARRAAMIYSRSFTWAETARKTHATYRQALGRH